MEAGLRNKVASLRSELASKQALVGELECRRRTFAQALAEAAHSLTLTQDALRAAHESLELKQSLLVDKDTIIAACVHALAPDGSLQML